MKTRGIRALQILAGVACVVPSVVLNGPLSPKPWIVAGMVFLVQWFRFRDRRLLTFDFLKPAHAASLVRVYGVVVEDQSEVERVRKTLYGLFSHLPRHELILGAGAFGIFGLYFYLLYKLKLDISAFDFAFALNVLLFFLVVHLSNLFFPLTVSLLLGLLIWSKTETPSVLLVLGLIALFLIWTSSLLIFQNTWRALAQEQLSKLQVKTSVLAIVLKTLGLILVLWTMTNWLYPTENPFKSKGFERTAGDPTWQQQTGRWAAQKILASRSAAGGERSLPGGAGQVPSDSLTAKKSQVSREHLSQLQQFSKKAPGSLTPQDMAQMQSLLKTLGQQSGESGGGGVSDGNAESALSPDQDQSMALEEREAALAKLQKLAKEYEQKAGQGVTQQAGHQVAQQVGPQKTAEEGSSHQNSPSMKDISGSVSNSGFSDAKGADGSVTANDTSSGTSYQGANSEKGPNSGALGNGDNSGEKFGDNSGVSGGDNLSEGATKNQEGSSQQKNDQAKGQTQPAWEKKSYGKSSQQLTEDKLAVQWEKRIERAVEIVGLIAGLACLGLLVHFLLNRKGSKPEDVKRVQISSEERRAIEQALRRVLSKRLSPEQEVVETYHLSIQILSAHNLPREEYQPPDSYRALVQESFPLVGRNFQSITQRFSQTFYGMKAAPPDLLSAFRSEFRMFLRYFKFT